MPVGLFVTLYPAVSSMSIPCPELVQKYPTSVDSCIILSESWFLKAPNYLLSWQKLSPPFCLG
jgi:hypothetical protein